jgi:hypothetical protein
MLRIESRLVVAETGNRAELPGRMTTDREESWRNDWAGKRAFDGAGERFMKVKKRVYLKAES